MKLFNLISIPHIMELSHTMRWPKKIRLPHMMEVSNKMRLNHQKMTLPHLMELVKTIRLPHNIRLAKMIWQDETASKDKVS